MNYQTNEDDVSTTSSETSKKLMISAGLPLLTNSGAFVDVQLNKFGREVHKSTGFDPYGTKKPFRNEYKVINKDIKLSKTVTLESRRTALQDLLIKDFKQEMEELGRLGYTYRESSP